MTSNYCYNNINCGFHSAINQSINQFQFHSLPNDAAMIEMDWIWFDWFDLSGIGIKN